MSFPKAQVVVNEAILKDLKTGEQTNQFMFKGRAHLVYKSQKAYQLFESYTGVPPFGTPIHTDKDAYEMASYCLKNQFH